MDRKLVDLNIPRGECYNTVYGSGS